MNENESHISFDTSINQAPFYFCSIRDVLTNFIVSGILCFNILLSSGSN